MNKKDKEQTTEIMQFIAGCIATVIPEEFGFATFVFPLNNKDGHANYISNAHKPDIMLMMQETLDRFKHQEHSMNFSAMGIDTPGRTLTPLEQTIEYIEGLNREELDNFKKCNDHLINKLLKSLV